MKKFSYGLIAGLLPSIVFAQIGGGTISGTVVGCSSDLCRVIEDFGSIVQSLVVIMASVALLVFFWGLVKYIASAGDAAKAKEGKSIMTYGVIALFVLFFIWGILFFIRDAFGINPTGTITPPQVQL